MDVGEPARDGVLEVGDVIDLLSAGAVPASSDTEVVHTGRMVEHDVLLVLADTHHAARALRPGNRVTDRS
jgi:hypothetical protein